MIIYEQAKEIVTEFIKSNPGHYRDQTLHPAESFFDVIRGKFIWIGSIPRKIANLNSRTSPAICTNNLNECANIFVAYFII